VTGMRWYLNDASLQGQFSNADEVEAAIRPLLQHQSRSSGVAVPLRTVRGLPERPVIGTQSLRHTVLQWHDRDLRRLVLTWLDRTGPFLEDDRIDEADDYFECLALDVTDSGLGEAARRIKNGEGANTYSFVGGATNFAATPLLVLHGLPEERFGSYAVGNHWQVADIARYAIEELEVRSWRELLVAARARYSRLSLPDSVIHNERLRSEPFSAAIADRALALLGHLNTYMEGRRPDGSDGPQAREVIEKFFVGDRALFTGESETNQRRFSQELTFPDIDSDGTLFAHWHGKISHRVYRLHFEWPVPPGQSELKVVYLGPKITKD
jgi:hypothetical protein